MDHPLADGRHERVRVEARDVFGVELGHLVTPQGRLRRIIDRPRAVVK